MENMKESEKLAKEINSASAYVVAISDGNHTADVITVGNAVEVIALATAAAVDVVRSLAKMGGERVAMQTAETIAKAMVEGIQAAVKESEGGKL